MTAPSIGLIPPDRELLGNSIFELGSSRDRDGVLLPWVSVRSALAERGIGIATIDACPAPSAWLHLDAWGPPPSNATPERTVVIVLEPEVVAPYWYRRARRGPTPYARVLVMSSELAARGQPFTFFHYPQVLASCVPAYERDLRIVMINGRKFPAVRRSELYSTRERVAAELARTGDIDIFGDGWGKIHPRRPVSSLRNVRIRPRVRGAVVRKVDVLARAQFCLCFENSTHRGYHTEKLFDAMAAGAIPIYLGDPDIARSVPSDTFVDFRDLGTTDALRELIHGMPSERRRDYRDAGQRFLRSPAFLRRYTVTVFAQRVADMLAEILE